MDPMLAAVLILSAVDAAAPDPAPSGVIFAGMMDRISLSLFNDVQGVLVHSGLIIKEGHGLTLTESGQESVNKLNEMF